jgi:hypothetical protein
MAIERWGSLSVADHNDVSALTANVLLYDRLVIPMYTESDDRDELAYWDKMGWHPEVQIVRRKQLGELAIECAWDKNKREYYSDRYKAALQINSEANGEMTTRLLLAMDKYPLPKGVNHADIFVGYDSEQSSFKEIPRSEAIYDELKSESRIGVLIAHEFWVPNIANPEESLQEAINLSKESEFRNKRSDLYDFQMNCLSRGMSPKAVVAELRDRNLEMVDYLQKQKIPLQKKAAFMLAQTLASVIAGSFSAPFGAIGGLISLWQFAKFDIKPNDDLPNRLLPVAAFHDIENKLNLSLGK